MCNKKNRAWLEENHMVIMNLPNKRMNHNGSGVVQVAYDGPPGLISYFHDRDAPVSGVSPVEVF